jgi:diaminopimelate decarboxylase
MNANQHVHAAHTRFPAVDGCLHIGGVSLTRLAQQLGSTPFYAYDRKLISDKVQQLRQGLPRDIQLHYSIKANPMPELVRHMAGLVDGFDVASGGELKTALDAGIAAQHIGFAGPGKTDAELAQAIAAGILVHLESERELERVIRIGHDLSRRPQAVVRVNPDFELKSSGMKMGGGPKPFGIDAEIVPHLLKRIGTDLDFHGFHIFSGSQSLRADAIADAQAQTFELALHLAEHAPQPMRLLNIGGGFGIPYFPGEAPLDLQPIADNLQNWLPRMQNALPGGVRFDEFSDSGWRVEPIGKGETQETGRREPRGGLCSLLRRCPAGQRRRPL